jgi:hypothetical protein
MRDYEADWRFKHLPLKAEQSRQAGGRLLSEASAIAAGCHQASRAASAAEPFNRKERSQFNEVVRRGEELRLRDWSNGQIAFVSGPYSI